MQFDPDDPRWTAYVLHELEGSDTAELEQQLAESASARQHVEELRQTIGLLSAELESEPVLQLSAQQRSAIEQHSLAASVSPAMSKEHRHGAKQGDFASRWLGIMVAVAASLLVVATLVVPGLQNANRTAEVAQLKPEPGREMLRYQQTPSSGGVAGRGGKVAESNGRVPASVKLSAATNSESGFVDAGRQPDRYYNESSGSIKDLADGERFGNTQAGVGVAESRSKRGAVDYTINKPVYETKTKDLGYTINKPEYEAKLSQAVAGGAQPSPRARLSVANGTEPQGQTAPQTGPTTSFHSQFGTHVIASGGEAGAAKNYAVKPYGWALQQPVNGWADGGAVVGQNFSGAGGGAAGGGFGGDNSQLFGKVMLGRQLKPGSLEYAAPTGEGLPAAVAAGTVVLSDGAEQDGFVKLQTVDGTQRGVVDGLGIVAPTQGLDALALGEAYDEVTDNAFRAASDDPLSTFSIDVDTASYSNVRRFLTQNHRLPPKSAVRIEEMLNYFSYDYPQPDGDVPFSANAEVAECPWNTGHRLVRIGLKGREIAAARRPASNLVFLVDVSGSMNEPNKLPLVKQSLRMLTEQLSENDRVAIVVYASASGLVLPSTTGNNRETITTAIDRLEAGGSTNGAQGIQLAYEIATSKFIPGGTNRVLLATDGDFNVGMTDRGELVKMIEQQAKSGVFLTTLGYGFGNLKDATLEQLADHGNGNYAYIDDVREAKKVFVEQMSGTLVTIAKDVKLQIEFNPAQVGSYRLIGYENRVLAHQDFNNDLKDAGDIGAGHTVTALYEIIPAAAADARPAVDALKYQQQNKLSEKAHSGELLTLKLRYKQPEAKESKLLEYPVKDSGHRYGQASRDFKFAASVAAFGMLLRDSPHKGTATMAGALELAQEGQGSDEKGYRQEFVSLIQQAKAIYEATLPAGATPSVKSEEPVTHTGPVPAAGEPVDSTRQLTAGDSLQVEWGGSWWQASVVEVLTDGNVKIHYSGWESRWDEVVPRSRLRK